MSRKNQSITLSVSAEDKAELEAIALAYGITWGDRPNISGLLEAIARHELIVSLPQDALPETAALQEAIALISKGLGKLKKI